MRIEVNTYQRLHTPKDLDLQPGQKITLELEAIVSNIGVDMLDATSMAGSPEFLPGELVVTVFAHTIRAVNTEETA